MRYHQHFYSEVPRTWRGKRPNIEWRSRYEMYFFFPFIASSYIRYKRNGLHTSFIKKNSIFFRSKLCRLTFLTFICEWKQGKEPGSAAFDKWRHGIFMNELFFCFPSSHMCVCACVWNIKQFNIVVKTNDVKWFMEMNFYE